jgi:hypothetical protein
MLFFDVGTKEEVVVLEVTTKRKGYGCRSKNG